MRTSHLILLLASLMAARPAAAQENGGTAEPRPSARLIAGGLLGGAAGLAVGGLVGVAIGANYCSDEGNPDSCRPIEGLVYGATAGESLSIPLGVHLANGRNGRLLPSMLASAAIGAAGAAILMHADSDFALGGVLVGVPLLQLVTSVLIERATTR